MCDWQQAASNVLVAVGKQFIGLVMEEVLSKFQPGALPHYFVVQTLANLAASNGRFRLACPHRHSERVGGTSPPPAPGRVAWGHGAGARRPGQVRRGFPDAPPPFAVFGMVPFLTSILSTMLPMLGMAKHDTMRVAFCCGKMGSPGRGLGAACPPFGSGEGHESSGQRRRAERPWVTADVWAGGHCCRRGLGLGVRPLLSAGRGPCTSRCGSPRPGHLRGCGKKPPQSRRDFPHLSLLSTGHLRKGSLLPSLPVCCPLCTQQGRLLRAGSVHGVEGVWGGWLLTAGPSRQGRRSCWEEGTGS